MHSSGHMYFCLASQLEAFSHARHIKQHLNEASRTKGTRGTQGAKVKGKRSLFSFVFFSFLFFSFLFFSSLCPSFSFYQIFLHLLCGHPLQTEGDKTRRLIDGCDNETPVLREHGHSNHSTSSRD